MKRILSLILLLAVLFTLPACGEIPIETSVSSTESTTESTAESTTETAAPVVVLPNGTTLPAHVELSEVITTLNEERSQYFQKNDFAGFEQYAPNDPTVKGLLTEEEAAALQENRSLSKMALTYDEAVSEIDLCFRMLKCAYGGYYYFGGDEAFDAAKEAIIADLPADGGIPASLLASLYKKHLAFIVDGHFSIGGSGLVSGNTSLQYSYYYGKDQAYLKDEKGYYKTIDGAKWYFGGFTGSGKNAEMKLTLLESGDIVYAPVLWSPSALVNIRDTLVLTRDGSQITEDVKWEKHSNYSPTGGGDKLGFKQFDIFDIVYTSVRSFSLNAYDKKLQEFVSTAPGMIGAKAIILDIRGNGGGSTLYAKQWLQSFAGIMAKACDVWLHRYNPICENARSKVGEEHDEYTVTEPRKLNNSYPVFILADSNVASAGEDMIHEFHCLNNTVVIGSNSRGCMICGNVDTYHLPTSVIQFYFGSSLMFYWVIKNRDGMGLAPDIWCDPSYAFEAIVNMFLKYGYLDAENENALWDEALGIGLYCRVPAEKFYLAIQLQKEDKKRIYYL
ncbi:MAG: hypothetical protein KBS76_07090 [Ruminococcus sp.]|nr:hypothetical protein [Candidatus Apopatosoma intestinale]